MHPPLAAILLLAWVALAQPGARAASGEHDRLESLAGKVEAEQGRPVRGATVIVYSASPASGPAIVGGRNHRECGLRAMTDKTGAFSIDGLRSDLRYRLLVVDDRYEPTFVADTTAPADDVRIVLAPRRLKTLAVEDHIVRGTLVDEKGSTVAGAIIEPRGYTRGNEGLVGPMNDLAALTVSNEQGEFYIETTRAVDTLEVAVRAPGFAPQFLSDIRVGRQGQTLTVVRGVTVQGRLVQGGRPIAGAVLGICPIRQTSGNYVGPWETVTDADGSFQFKNVTANEEMGLYGKLDSLKRFGALPVSRVMTGVNESTLDVGELAVGAGHKLTVHLRLPDDAALPTDLRLMIWQDGTRDMYSVAPSGENAFEVDQLPAGLYRIGLSGWDSRGPMTSPFQKKYRPSKRNLSLDESRPGSLLGRIDQDVVVDLEMEPGDSTVLWSLPPGRDVNLVQLRVQELRELPLRGVGAAAAPLK